MIAKNIKIIYTLKATQNRLIGTLIPYFLAISHQPSAIRLVVMR